MKRTSFMPPNGCSPTVPLDPVQSAKAADLRYVSDAKPGIRRVKAGKHFRYVDPAGVPVRDPEVLARIRCLVIPPAWTDVWICPIANGHLQATGRDARGRKQYQYHPRWREVRDLTKYGRMVAFGGKLPRIRRRVRSDLRVPRLPREKVLATVVRLLELTCMRVGNEEYARTNNSYGITTLRDRHARIAGPILEFRFRGKRGKEHVVRVTDRRLARIVKRCQDIPGYELFQYIDESGNRQSIDSEDVNSYLRMITGEDFTAKDFRTWAGTVQAAVALRDIGPATSVSKAKKNVVQAIQTVAELLGNTPAICRKCYIHPGVIDSYMQGTLLDRLLNGEADAGPRAGLTKDERVVLAFLRAAPARAA